LQDEPEATRSGKIKNLNNGVANLKPWPNPHWRLDQR
jgi:hypothetical protein